MAQAKDKLSYVEALRAIDKLKFLDHIPKNNSGGELLKAVAEEIASTINVEAGKKQDFEKLMKLRETQRGLTDRASLLRTETQIQALTKSLRESNKNLCSHLDNAPNEEKNLEKVSNERATLITWFQELEQEIRDAMTFDQLSQHADSRKRESEELPELLKKNAEKTSQVKVAEGLLRDIQHEAMKTQKEEEAAILSLKSELKQVRSEASMRLALEGRRLLAREHTRIAQWQQEEQTLQKELESLRDLQAKLKVQHTAVESTLQLQANAAREAASLPQYRDIEGIKL